MPRSTPLREDTAHQSGDLGVQILAVRKDTAAALAGVVAIAYELHFFTANIATPAADNAAFTLVVADTALWRGCVPIETADYKAAASAFNMACVRGVGLEVQAGAATTDKA